MTTDQLKKQILKHGLKSSGKTNYLKYLNGKKIGLKGAVLSKCFECSGFYADGRLACNIKNCPLFPWMPYAKRNQEGSVPPKIRANKDTKVKNDTQA